MLDKDKILQIISQELQNASGSVSNTEGTVSFEDSLSLYLGRPDGKEIEGRSHVISTDVADAIEWIMPQVMKSFTQNNEIVVFDPVKPGDEMQAELESEYVYEVLMKQNDGFIILHQFVKDALMQKNGILKIYYAEKTHRKVSDWTGITQQQLQNLLMMEGIELIEKTEYVDQMLTLEKQQSIELQLRQVQQSIQNQEQMAQAQPMIEQLQAEYERPVYLCDVKVVAERKRGQIYVDPVPPEEFRISDDHNSINPDSARFTAHVCRKPISDVIQEYDITFDEATKLPKSSGWNNSEYRFQFQDESIFYEKDYSADEAENEIEVAECFLMIDIDQTGISKLMKITVAGDETPTEILLAEEIDGMPWVATTAFLMSHKFKGLSITDRLKEIQEQKTALWRNILDNMYLQNNQRNVVIEGQVNIDDLLVSRPGGIIRAKRADAVIPLATPQIQDAAYTMMDYLDRVRAGRTGVDPDGTATPQNIGDRVGSEGVDRILNAKEELVGLIIRVTAETGVKPLCVKIRNLSIKHINAIHDFKFRGVWHKINPSEWCDRIHCTVRVGTGSGNHLAQRAALGEVLALQDKILQNPQQALVNEQRTFNTIDDFCKFSGLNGATRYFLDPQSPEGKQERAQKDAQNKQIQQIQQQKEKEVVDLQKQLANAEMGKVVAQQQAAKAKQEADADKGALQLMKQEYEKKISLLKQQLEADSMITDSEHRDADRDLKKYEIDQRTAVELTRIGAQQDQKESDTFEENKEIIQ